MKDSEWLGMTIGACCMIVLTFWFAYHSGVHDGKSKASPSPVKCECKCPCKLPQIFIDENTDIPNNPLKPLTPEEFQKLQDELRKAGK